MADKKEQIQKRNQTFKELFEAGDMASLGDALFAPDCKMMIPGEKTTEGKEDAQKILASLKTEGAAQVSLCAIEVGPFGDGELLYERGEYDFTKDDKSPYRMGKYLVIWKLIDGEYKRYIEILNSGN